MINFPSLSIFYLKRHCMGIIHIEYWKLVQYLNEHNSTLQFPGTYWNYSSPCVSKSLGMFLHYAPAVHIFVFAMVVSLSRWPAPATQSPLAGSQDKHIIIPRWCYLALVGSCSFKMADHPGTSPPAYPSNVWINLKLFTYKCQIISGVVRLMIADTYMNPDIGQTFGQQTTMVQFYFRNDLDFLWPYGWLFGILTPLNCKTLCDAAGSQNPTAVLYRNTVSAFTYEHELPLMWSHPEERKLSALHWSGLKVKMRAAPVECRLHVR